MKNKKIFKNYLYNLTYQIFVILVPLVTTPYVSKILEADGIGKYSYSNSIANYFVLIAGFGFLTYGQREIAKTKNNLTEQSRAFWEIIISRLILLGLVSSIYLFLLQTGIFGNYTFLMKILFINILAVGADISFFFSGNEEFAKLTIRNILVKTIGVVCIFAFVKTKDDLSTYVIINSIATIGGNLSLWPYLFRKVCLCKVNFERIVIRIKETFIFFIPTIAITIYTILDKTLIGILISGNTYKYETIDGVEKLVEIKISDLENGYYEQAEKIIKLALTIITSLSTVIYSRNSVEIGKGNYSEAKNNFYLSTSITWLLGIPISLGCFAIASNLVPWFLGEEYSKSILLMRILSPLPIFIGFANVIGYQYIMTSGREKIYTLSVTVASILNFLINMMLIPILLSAGAVIGTIIAELTGPTICLFYIRKEISISRMLRLAIKPAIAGGIMFIITLGLSINWVPCVKNTLLIIIISAIVYVIVLFMLKEPLITTISNTLRKRKK